ncbi:T9SS type A sorting domain-containing protein [uncultured Algibacter sp.]|uniref:T9SS type A sorting domain-containing protein n=1 Tax=uncultured Algibacter sp. TaxID=298659 RepID=UPI0030EBC9A6|tara:strand:+ start:931 stop:2235 length:1305 start_codon:yes stop_codon:yes gene_type:complete
MKKITLLFIVVLATTLGYAQNLITNGTFDDATGWTVVNQYGTDSTNGLVTFSSGTVNFTKSDPSDGGWIHMGIYTSITLTAGWYQFDMDMAFDGINSIWGEVYIGAVEPVQNVEYSGDQQVIKAYNAWDCAQTYTGTAVAFGCDDTNPGKFEITSGGTYYLLFRSGGATYGASGVTLDNWSLVTTTAPPVPTPLTDFSFDFDTATPLAAAEGATYNDDAINTVTDGINPTANVGELSAVNGTWYSQLTYQYNDGIDLTSGDRGFSIKVKGPRTIPVKIKVEDGGDAAEATVNYTTPNVWQQLIFDFSAFNSNNNKKIALFFGYEEDDTAFPDANDNIFQIDDYVFGAFATLSAKDFQIEGLSVYPNPTTDTWNISTKNQVIKSVEVFSILGKRVLALRPNSVKAIVDATSLNSGIYFTKISTELGTQIKKLIKR